MDFVSLGFLGGWAFEDSAFRIYPFLSQALYSAPSCPWRHLFLRIDSCLGRLALLNIPSPAFDDIVQLLIYPVGVVRRGVYMTVYMQAKEEYDY